MKYTLDKPTFLFGDNHGNLRGISHFITDHDEYHDINIIVLGDCGLMIDNWTGDWLSINKKAATKNIMVYIFRGNHDNPDFFKKENNLSNLTILEDFDEINLIYNGQEFSGLIYPGALSVDRSWRWKMANVYQNKKLWYEGENIKPIPEDIKNYDFILGHGGLTPPSIDADPSFLNSFIPYDEKLLDDIKAEQNNYKKLLEATKPTYFIYGHFHISESFTYNDIKCQALDINEWIEFKPNKKDSIPVGCRVFSGKCEPKSFT